jgi:hypothetical protein
MRRMVFIFLIVGLLLGLSVNAFHLNAQDTSSEPEEENGPNIFLGGLVLIWFLLHKLL